MNDSRVKNIIIDEILKKVEKEKKIKTGFFAGEYLKNFGRKKSGRILITEEFVRNFLKTGGVLLTIPKSAIITPLARELIEEGNIKISYE
ncbi:MAG: hypothetical protein J7L54_03060 [Elusimicrobia bacterium]|nr:hypothetical protein [Elusimicrobiota bacterium]